MATSKSPESAAAGEVDDRDVYSYEDIDAADEFPPFKLVLPGFDRFEIGWPLASTVRAIDDAARENRINDMFVLLCGTQWGLISEALDALGPRGTSVQQHFGADMLEHFRMSAEAVERVKANRQERRAELRARRRRR